MHYGLAEGLWLAGMHRRGQLLGILEMASPSVGIHSQGMKKRKRRKEEAQLRYSLSRG